MRRTPTLVSSVAVRSFSLSHAPAYDGAAITTTFTLQHRLFQATPYRSSSNAASCAFRRRFWPLMNSFFVKASSIGLPGALFSVAALSLSQEVYAKEPQPPDLVPNDVVLYQYEACPFCNKVKAFLDYYDVKYKVVEVNPLSKKEIKWSDYKKVPILVVDGEQLVDSSAIIDELGHRILQRKVVESDIEDDEEQKWRKWVDDHLVHVLSPNIYRNTAEALEAFNYITNNGNYSFIEKITVKYAGAAAMYFVSKNLKKKYNINDEREALYEAAETWVNALAGREFLGGSKPNIADLAVFGVLRPIRYLRSGRDMVEHTQIGEWYTRMESVVGESSRVEA